MKLKCTPEGRDLVWRVKPQDMHDFALHWFESTGNEQVHTMVPYAFAMLGADWSKESFLESVFKVDDEHMGWAVVLDPAGSIPMHHVVLATDRLVGFDFGIKSVHQLDQVPS